MIGGMDAIDAFVQSLIFGGDGGTDFSKLVTKHSYNGTTAHKTYTHIDITGKGWFLGASIWAGAREVAVQIDGGPILGWSSSSSQPYLHFGGLMRFNTSLKVTMTTDPRAFVYANYLLE